MNSKKTYQEIARATTILGSVQFISIVVSLIRNKVVAVLVGSSGVGILGLFTSSLGLISSLTSLGLETSAVKSISTANLNPSLLSKEVTIIKKIIWLTAILGTLLTIVISPFLSELTFGNSDYTLAFVLVSVSLFFKQMTVGELAVIQGLQKVRFFANANLFGNIFALCFSIPLYYFYRIDGIVPSIIVSSIVVFLVALFYGSKLKIEKTKIENKAVFKEGKAMMKLGFSLSFIGLLSTLTAYLLQIYISNFKSIADVGFYNAGFLILNTYVGIIFTAMVTDYFPRLSKDFDDDQKVTTIVSQQIMFGLLLLCPVVVLFIALAKYFVPILFTDEFLEIIPYIVIGIIGMLFKSVSWSLGYVLIAKGDSKVFIKTSIFFNAIFLLLNILTYKYFGLGGLGVTFVVNHFIHFIVLNKINQMKYNVFIDNEIYKTLLISLIFGFSTLFIHYCFEGSLKIVLFIMLIFISSIFSFYHLNRIIDFKNFRNK